MTLIRLTQQKPEIRASSMGHMARKGFSLAFMLDYHDQVNSIHVLKYSLQKKSMFEVRSLKPLSSTNITGWKPNSIPAQI